jgi:hypothetical protein
VTDLEIHLWDELVKANRRLGRAEGLIAALNVETLRVSHSWPESYYWEYWNRLMEKFLEEE